MTDQKALLAKTRVDQVGSLVAPASLIAAFDRRAQGEMSAEALRGAQETAIRDVVRKQLDVGLTIVTDGEFRRRNFQESFSAAVAGFEAPPRPPARETWHEPNQPLHRTEQNFNAAGPAIITRRAAVERLSLKHNVLIDEYRFLAPLSDAVAKVSLIGPDRISQRFAWERSKSVYPDLDAFIADVVAIQRQMIQEIVDAGCRYVHIDAPGFTAYVDQVSLDRMRLRGEDPQRNLERAIEAENAVIAGFDDVTFALHICRGNPRGVDASGKVRPQWHREGHYDAIAEQLFSGLKHDRLMLEYDSDRAGSFSALRFVRKQAVAVLGVVTTKSAEVESVDFIKRRLDEAFRHIAPDQVAISPQCGFNSGVGEIQIDEAAQWRKFERLIETARDIWR